MKDFNLFMYNNYMLILLILQNLKSFKVLEYLLLLLFILIQLLCFQILFYTILELLFNLIVQ